MSNFRKTYVVVEYVEEESMFVIPRAWIKGSEAYWPPYVTDSQCRNAAKTMEVPCNGWQLYPVKEWAENGKDCFRQYCCL